MNIKVIKAERAWGSVQFKLLQLLHADYAATLLCWKLPNSKAILTHVHTLTKKKEKNPCRLHARPLLLKPGQPQNEQSQPLCSSRQRWEARLQLKLKLMAFLIGAHVCQSDRVLATWTTSAHLPRQHSLLPLVGRQLQSGWIKLCVTTGADGDVWFVILSNQAGTDSGADGVHSRFTCILKVTSHVASLLQLQAAAHEEILQHAVISTTLKDFSSCYLHLNQNLCAWLSLHLWQAKR